MERINSTLLKKKKKERDVYPPMGKGKETRPDKCGHRSHGDSTCVSHRTVHIPTKNPLENTANNNVNRVSGE